MSLLKTIEWRDDQVIMIDQRVLPTEEVYLTFDDYGQVTDAIKKMVIRGAPAIGVAGAMGVALGALGIDAKDYQTFSKKMTSVLETVGNARPTAVNFRWAVERMRQKMESLQSKPIP